MACAALSQGGRLRCIPTCPFLTIDEPGAPHFHCSSQCSWRGLSQWLSGAAGVGMCASNSRGGGASSGDEGGDDDCGRSYQSSSGDEEEGDSGAGAPVHGSKGVGQHARSRSGREATPPAVPAPGTHPSRPTGSGGSGGSGSVLKERHPSGARQGPAGSQKHAGQALCGYDGRDLESGSGAAQPALREEEERDREYSKQRKGHSGRRGCSWGRAREILDWPGRWLRLQRLKYKVLWARARQRGWGQSCTEGFCFMYLSYISFRTLCA
jgi:hypothetical protein